MIFKPPLVPREAALTDAIAKRGARPYGTNYKKASSKNPLFLGLARRKPRKVSLAHRA
jgi:hypothetical protein